MCICVNCKWVDRCKTYHDVEEKHEADHLSLNPDLEPKNPFIHVNLVEETKGEFTMEWDVRSCSSF